MEWQIANSICQSNASVRFVRVSLNRSDIATHQAVLIMKARTQLRCIAPRPFVLRRVIWAGLGKLTTQLAPATKWAHSNHRRMVFLFAKFMNSATAIELLVTLHFALMHSPAARREMTRDEIAAGCNWGAHPTPTCLQYSFVAPAVVCMIGARCSL